MTRHHHPLEGLLLEVIKGGPVQVVVRLPNGSPMRVPRSWTDADGAPSTPPADRFFTVDSLLELVELVGLLGRRP